MKEAQNKLKKRFFVVANWKMNKTIREAETYVESLVPTEKVSLWIAVPFTAISACRKKLSNKILVGAQNMNDATAGAFTGEVSGVMLREAGADFVLLGHSERRQYFHETDEFINKKVLRALRVPLKPILCIGELFEEREAGQTKEVLERQLQACLKDVSKDLMKGVTLAYEPIWAIGTGRSATPDLVQETHAHIRSILEAMYDKKTAQATPLLYGGSVTPATTESLAACDGVDGFLVGTASLDPQSFAKIAVLSENVISV